MIHWSALEQSCWNTKADEKEEIDSSLILFIKDSASRPKLKQPVLVEVKHAKDSKKSWCGFSPPLTASSPPVITYCSFCGYSAWTGGWRNWHTSKRKRFEDWYLKTNRSLFDLVKVLRKTGKTKTMIVSLILSPWSSGLLPNDVPCYFGK